METGTVIFFGIVLVILFIILGYAIYQLKRNTAVYDIRINWIEQFDDRLNQYTYSDMFDPSKSNQFGLQWPDEKNYINKLKQ